MTHIADPARVHQPEHARALEDARDALVRAAAALDAAGRLYPLLSIRTTAIGAAVRKQVLALVDLQRRT